MTLKEYFDKNKALNASEVARAAGVPVQSMQDILCGHRLPSEKRLKEIETGIRLVLKNAKPIKLTRF